MNRYGDGGSRRAGGSRALRQRRAGGEASTTMRLIRRRAGDEPISPRRASSGRRSTGDVLGRIKAVGYRAFFTCRSPTSRILVLLCSKGSLDDVDLNPILVAAFRSREDDALQGACAVARTSEASFLPTLVSNSIASSTVRLRPPWKFTSWSSGSFDLRSSCAMPMEQLGPCSKGTTRRRDASAGMAASWVVERVRVVDASR